MKDLEQIFQNLNIPSIEDKKFETELHRNLLNRNVKTVSIYKTNLRLSLVFCCFLLFWGTLNILKPEFALKLNNLVFRKSEMIVNAASHEQALKNLAYTSVYHPELVKQIDPEVYEEDKTYLVRKYVSSETGGLMIVSEFDNRKSKARKISY
jgi:hypothetical protein